MTDDNAASVTDEGHEHYWTDAHDDEEAWHCTICGVTEYPASATDEGPNIDRYAGAERDAYRAGYRAGVARPAVPAALDEEAFTRTLRAYADRAHDNETYRTLVPEVVLRDAAAVIDDYRARLAATPTASPTAPTHVHEWEAWDSTDPNESWFACVSGCNAVVRRRLASPTATGERDD